MRVEPDKGDQTKYESVNRKLMAEIRSWREKEVMKMKDIPSVYPHQIMTFESRPTEASQRSLGDQATSVTSINVEYSVLVYRNRCR